MICHSCITPLTIVICCDAGVNDQRNDTPGLFQSMSLRLAHSLTFKAGDMADVAAAGQQNTPQFRRLTSFPKGRKDV